jgi:hypothetical protein
MLGERANALVSITNKRDTGMGYNMMTVKEKQAKIIFFVLGCLLWCVYGCTTIGTADKATMMQKWRGQKHTVALLDDINSWANWYHKGNPLERGKCVEQTEEKIFILNELGIPAKRMHCLITCDDPYHPISHAFVIAQLGNDWYLMDNGTINNCVWEYQETIKASWGITNECVMH